MNKVQLFKIKKTLEDITSIIEDSSSDYVIFQETLNSPEKFTEYAVKRIGKKSKEHLLVCYLNSKSQLIHSEIVSIGIVNSALVHPREVFRSAIKLNASHIIVAHNHPSGDLTPSDADRDVAKRLSEVGKLIGIGVLDNLVVNRTHGISVRV